MPNYKFELKDKNAKTTSIQFVFYLSGHRFKYGTSQVIEPMHWNFDNLKSQHSSKSRPTSKIEAKKHQYTIG